MRATDTRRFSNEYGNAIEMHGLIRTSRHGFEHVIYNITGPDSHVSNTLTVKEAQALRDILIELVGTP